MYIDSRRKYVVLHSKLIMCATYASQPRRILVASTWPCTRDGWLDMIFPRTRCRRIISGLSSYQWQTTHAARRRAPLMSAAAAAQSSINEESINQKPGVWRSAAAGVVWFRLAKVWINKLARLQIDWCTFKINRWINNTQVPPCMDLPSYGQRPGNGMAESREASSKTNSLIGLVASNLRAAVRATDRWEEKILFGSIYDVSRPKKIGTNQARNRAIICN